MNPVISIRIPDQTRSEMKKLRRFINWNQEIRDFISKRIDDKKKDDILASVTERLRNNPVSYGMSVRAAPVFRNTLCSNL